jgi:hypothetical protein
MLQVPAANEAPCSPTKSCPKSPLKRMKSLEEQESKENNENIETTYEKQNSPDKVLESKYLLGATTLYQDENDVTET